MRLKSPTATSTCTSGWELLARCRPHAIELAAAHAGYEAIGDRLGAARCRWAESSLLLMDHRVVESYEALREVLVIFRERGDANYEGLTMGSLAIGSFAMGDLVGADRWFARP